MNAKTERFELRLEPEVLLRIDEWREEQDDRPSRAEAVRRLVGKGLGRGRLNLRDSDRLIIMMLHDLSKKIVNPKTTAEIDVDFVSDAIHGGHYWGLEWEYSGLFHDHEDDRVVVSEVGDILDMWNFVELSFDSLKIEEKRGVLSEADLPGAGLEFTGFDGNHEIEHRNVALFLIEKMNRYSIFKGRDLNSHSPSLDQHRNMLRIFKTIRPRLDGRRMRAGEIISVLKVRYDHPSR
jgi:uncharacterized protein